MVSFAVIAASLCILASLAALVSTAASLSFFLRMRRGRFDDCFGAKQERPSGKAASHETEESQDERLRREREAREQFEDGLRAVLGYGNPVSGGKAGHA